MVKKTATSPEIPWDESDDEPPSGAEGTRDVADKAIIDALIAGRSQSEAGQAAGRSERTVRRRLRDPGFLARLAEAREEQSLRPRARSAALEERATAAIEELLGSDFEPGIRIRAAATALCWTSHTVQIDLEARLAILEDRLVGEEVDQ